MRQRIQNILQSEQNPQSFFIGEEHEFFDEDGNGNIVKILARLDELEQAMKIRKEKMSSRQAGTWLNDMGRKVAQALSIIDQIVAQYAEGTDRETQIEVYEQRIMDL